MKIPNEERQREKFLLFLKEVRQKSGIRQVELAKRLGAQQSFVSKYEGGSRRLDILELREICHVLGISLGDFIRQMEERLDETK
jgi:transcriptional regulator with XRE-family HTH domain